MTMTATRKHICDPEITVIMETAGMHQSTISRAVESFLDQTYDRARLLVVNYHPQRLRMSGVPAGAKIEIVNERDVHVRHVYQHIHNLKMVDTDCWAVLDDDDWIDPDHLSNLVEFWNRQTLRTEKPLRVCGTNMVAHYDSESKVVALEGWAQSVFERLTAAEVDHCFSLFPKDVCVGSDTWICTNTYYDRRNFNNKPTYHWDRRGPVHVSQFETCADPCKDPEALFRNVSNFWRNKLEAYGSELLPVELYAGGCGRIEGVAVASRPEPAAVSVY